MQTKYLIAILVIAPFIVLQNCDPSTSPGPNHHPEIITLSQRGNGIPIRGSDTVYCIARDEDDDKLEYQWTVSSGTFEDLGSEIIWYVPDEYATYPINCIVTDGKGGYDSRELIVQVFDYDTLYVPFGTISPNIRFPIDTLVVIDNQTEFTNLWETYWTGWTTDIGPTPLPTVNFDSLMVIGISAGEGAASGCKDDLTFFDYAYTIRDTLFIHRTAIGWSEKGFCFAEIEPRHWITIPNLGLPIEFTGCCFNCY